jgi:hypothetical protein
MRLKYKHASYRKTLQVRNNCSTYLSLKSFENQSIENPREFVMHYFVYGKSKQFVYIRALLDRQEYKEMKNTTKHLQ